MSAILNRAVGRAIAETGLDVSPETRPWALDEILQPTFLAG